MPRLIPAQLLLPALVCGALLPAQSGRAPSAKRQLELARSFLELDARRPADRAEQRKILEQLDSVPPLSPSQLKSWRKKLRRAFSRGVRLATKAGRHYFWEQPTRRGLYILGGKISARPAGLLIGLHGGGAGSGSARSAQGALDSAAKKLGWLAIYPEVLRKTEHGWTDSGTEEWLLDLIAAARRTWKIDPDRIYLAGHSMGGFGTWTVGARSADLFAGLAPSAGAPTPILDRETDRAIDIVEGVIPCLRNVRLRIYQSDDDPRVSPDTNRAAARRLAEARTRWGGFDYEYWEVSGRGHAGPPGGHVALLQKIASAERDARPQRIVWQPSKTWKRQFYWLHWERPALQSVLTAEVDRAANTVRIECAEPPVGLVVLLDDSMLDLEREVVVKVGSREVYRGTPEARLSTLLMTAWSGDPERLFALGIPVDG